MPVAWRLLRALREAGAEVALIFSPGAERVIRAETDLDPAEFRGLAKVVFDDRELAAPVASGSNPTRGMVIVPCSSNTVARVALGLADTLVARAAHVHLKERRKLIVVPRETPLSPILLGHLTRLAELGVVVLPVAPAYYLKPTHIDEVTDYLAGKILDQFGLPHALYRGWRGEELG